MQTHIASPPTYIQSLDVMVWVVVVSCSYSWFRERGMEEDEHLMVFCVFLLETLTVL